jgi:phage tail sheath protein FI
VSTSTTGLIGVTERGPVDVPILITSFGEYRRWFGERLNPADFTNPGPPPDPHWYFPLAVDGFFTNGGKRAYVTRILPAEATPAETVLFGRADIGFADSVLLRAAGQGTGTAANRPRLYVADPLNLAANDWVRVGDGSAAEYHQIGTVAGAAANTHVPLGHPLSLGHATAAPVDEFARVAPDAYTLDQAVREGSAQLVLNGAAAALGNLAVNEAIEIGPAGEAEFRFITGVDPIVGATRLVRLDHPLAFGYGATTAAARLTLPAPPATPPVAPATELELPAVGGDSLLFVVNRGGAFNVQGNLVRIDGGTAALREVRRIGVLSTLPLTVETYDSYPAGSRVEPLALADDDRQIRTAVAAVVPPVFVIDLDDATGLAVGERILVGGAANPHIIDAVDVANRQVTLRTPLLAVLAVGDPVVRQPRSLTRNANEEDLDIQLDNRLGLVPGDVLRIGPAGTAEFVTIASVVGDREAAPDPGAVIVTRPLRGNHVVNDPVRRQLTPLAANIPPTFLVLGARQGVDDLIVSDATGYAAATAFRVTTPSGTHYHVVAAVLPPVAPVEVELLTPLRRTHAAGAAFVERRGLITVQALDHGSWGNRLRVSVQDETRGLVTRAGLRQVFPPDAMELTSPTGVESGTVLELLLPNADDDDPPIGPPLKVRRVDRNNNNRILLDTPLAAAHLNAHAAAQAGGNQLRVRSREFRVSVFLLRQADPAIPSRGDAIFDTELFINLSMDRRHSRYFRRIIGPIPGAGIPVRLEDERTEGESRYIRTEDRGTLVQQVAIRLGPETLVDLLPNGTPRAARHPLLGGDDSLATLTDPVYIGSDAIEPIDRTGLFTLRNIEEISLVAAPGRTSALIQGALIDHCEHMRYRFAVLDGPVPPNDGIPDVRAQRQQFDTKYAALYHPWLMVPEPFPAVLTPVPLTPIPPSGHVLGVYARTDIERGVHKAPANEVIRGALGLRRALNKSEHDILNPYPVNINVIRDFRSNNRGIRIYGGRVITADSDFKYVNVRRLLIFIEASIDRGLQWVVFEPNAEPLWARVRRTIANFLTVVWRNGALEGTRVEEAYFVKCDRTTMTQLDIDSGRLICVIGIAPVKPAEFVIIRIGLWTAHAEA